MQLVIIQKKKKRSLKLQDRTGARVHWRTGALLELATVKAAVTVTITANGVPSTLLWDHASNERARSTRTGVRRRKSGSDK